MRGGRWGFSHQKSHGPGPHCCKGQAFPSSAQYSSPCPLAAGPTAKMTVSMGVGGAFLGSLGSFRGQGQSLPWCECRSRAGILRPLCRLLACPSWHSHGPSSQSQSGSGGLGWYRPAGPLSLPVKPKTQKVSPRRSEKGASHAKERKESFLESKSLVTPHFLPHQV